MDCIYCKSEKIYTLSNGLQKCSSCKRKFSPKKIEKDLELIEVFCNDINGFQASKKLKISYGKASDRYMLFRVLLTPYLERLYEQRETKVSEYNEYLYITDNKKNKIEYIFDAHNFITFDYGLIYNIPMPKLNIYKESFNLHESDKRSLQEFEKFLKYNKIAKLTNLTNTINRFWKYFESFMKQYKGVSDEHFVYYLKEGEFKFNFGLRERVAILTELYLDSIKKPISL